MNAATFDKSRLLTLYARIGETGNPIVLTFYNADGSEYNVESKGFKLIVKKRANSTPVLFTLSEGEGVTASGNQLTLSPSAANLTQKRDVNFYTLYSEDEDKTWLNGAFIFHDGEFDGVNQTNEITIGDSSVTIQVTGGNSDTRTSTITSTATLTPNISNFDFFEITAQAEALTIENPTGSIVNGNGFVLRITDDGTSRGITFGDKYRGFGDGLPTATTLGKTLYMPVVYNQTDDKYDVLSSIIEV